MDADGKPGHEEEKHAPKVLEEFLWEEIEDMTVNGKKLTLRLKKEQVKSIISSP